MQQEALSRTLSHEELDVRRMTRFSHRYWEELLSKQDWAALAGKADIGELTLIGWQADAPPRGRMGLVLASEEGRGSYFLVSRQAVRMADAITYQQKGDGQLRWFHKGTWFASFDTPVSDRELNYAETIAFANTPLPKTRRWMSPVGHGVWGTTWRVAVTPFTVTIDTVAEPVFLWAFVVSMPVTLPIIEYYEFRYPRMRWNTEMLQWE